MKTRTRSATGWGFAASAFVPVVASMLLAAPGALCGARAPWPFTQGSLAQSVEWDRENGLWDSDRELFALAAEVAAAGR